MVSKSIRGPRLMAIGPGNGCDKYDTLDAAPGYSEERKEEILKAYFERLSLYYNGMVSSRHRTRVWRSPANSVYLAQAARRKAARLDPKSGLGLIS